MTFEFDVDGFLTDRKHVLERSIDEVYGRLLTHAREINRDCHELIFEADVRNRDANGLVVATLFLRALEHYQATLILLAIGLVAPAKAALRTLMETVFRLRAVAGDKNALCAFIDADLLHRRKLINKARQHDHAALAQLRGVITDRLIEELNEEIELRSVKDITIEQLSKLAGMHDWYTTAYAMLSKAVHSQARELDSYLKLDRKEEVRELVYGPSMEEIPDLAVTAAHCILLAASAVDNTFGIGFGPKGNEHLERVESAYEALRSKFASASE